MFSSFYVSLQFAFINILFAITRAPADERCALKHQSISASCKTCKYRHFIIPEACSRHTADCLLNISSGVDQRPSTRNIDQSQLRIPQSLPAHSGVSTVTGMSALIRAKGCWSGHPGWLSSQASHYAASRSRLSLSLALVLWGAESYLTTGSGELVSPLDQWQASSRTQSAGLKVRWDIRGPIEAQQTSGKFKSRKQETKIVTKASEI